MSESMYSLERVVVNKDFKLDGWSLVGISGHSFPLSHGNYFSVKNGGEELNIINMNKENFSYLKDVEWEIYKVLDRDNNDTNGYILYNKDLPLEWYLKGPYLYSTTIKRDDFDVEKGFNTNLLPYRLTYDNVGEYINKTLGKDYKIKVTDRFKIFDDLKEDNVMFQILNVPYDYWVYSYGSLEINIEKKNIDRIAFIVQNDTLYIRTQVIDDTVEKLQEKYEFSEFKEKMKNLTADGYAYYYNLDKESKKATA